MIMSSRMLKAVGLHIAAAVMMLTPVTAWAEAVKKIEVTGSERIEEATVVSYMDLKVGDELDDAALNRALKSLFSTGLFADVNVEDAGSGVVHVSIVENPIINQISFEGNDKIDDDELLAEIQMRPRQVFTRTKVQSDLARLNQIYRRQGRFSVNIEPKVIRLDQNRVDLVFEIDEGDVTVVKTIRFVGNKKFDDDKLRSIISTKETAWYKFLSSDDRYDEDRLAYDQELLRNFYLSRGYADFSVVSAVAELSPDKKSFFITFTIEEGERYKVAGTSISSELRNFDTSTLQDSISVATGDWYNAEKVRDSVNKMTDLLGDMQYAFVNVRPDIQKDREKREVFVLFTVSETPPVYVERININGNVRTMDKVLRREMEVVEGDPFNRTKIAKSEQNIKDLDFFENVNLDVKQGSAPDKTVIDVDVDEKSTGELSIGAGFSTSDGPLADFRVRERNLLGKGQDLTFATTLAGKRSEFDVSFTEPYFLDRDLSAGFDLFHMTRDLQSESSYDQRRTGGALRMGYPLSENWRQTLKYQYEKNDIDNVSSTASRFIRDQEGVRTTSAVSQHLTYDTRDSAILTTEGLYSWLDTELAGLGGDAKYISGRTGGTYYYPVMDQVVVNALGEVGAIQGYSGKDVEINDRFFIGGSTLRGFERSGIGPRDKTTDDALGGNLFYRGSLEGSFPVGLPKEMGVKGHLFTDFGSLMNIDESGANLLEENSIRASAGLGVSWRSPIGPIRVDLAMPYAKEDFDKEENFRFDFGTRF
ncbi:MAG: outer membrane protein assembly factor BamA [Rhodospirillales bacterium]|nr:outer membrane protein assembly factor BamA [Alphaproteobacteria bacterium]MCB9977433.1 outer membrane protein assembly factor BamA [Rhodospirillales bacterium]